MCLAPTTMGRPVEPGVDPDPLLRTPGAPPCDELCKQYIKRYISRFRQMGSVAPTIQQREQPLIKAAQAPAVQAMVDEHPDATLEAYCEDWEKRTGQRVSDSTMSRALERFDRPRKKNGGRRRAG